MSAQVRKAGWERDFAIVGQGCIPEVREELCAGTSALVGYTSHEPETYGPRPVQLGIPMLRRYTTLSCNCVHRCAVTPETLAEEKPAKPPQEHISKAIAASHAV